MSATNEKTWTFEDFSRGATPLPSPNLCWNAYGVGLDAIGFDGAPEPATVGEPASDQLMVRVDAVGLCFSDVKLINQGGDHPKLYGRDLSTDPTRLGHEVSVTVIAVGADLVDTYSVGQRLAIQPDIHIGGRSTAYGYTVPGGLIQYHLVGPEVLAGDDGASVIPVAEIGYAAAALSEPWACVEASYTQRRRLEPLVGGTMWILGHEADDSEYSWSGTGLAAPARIVLTNVSPQVADLVEGLRSPTSTVERRDGLTPDQFAAMSAEVRGGEGFDDIVMLDPSSSAAVEAAAREIAFRGTMAMVGTRPLDGLPNIDVGRIHYHYTALLGTSQGDISSAYGEARNRSELRPGGTAVFIGGAGPMGQMHMQRALEKADGPAIVIGVDLDDDRIQSARAMLDPLAERQGKTIVFVNPGSSETVVPDLVRELTEGGCDDVVVTVPSGPVMGDAASLMAPDGMLVLFAGVPNGTMAAIDVSDVYLGNSQITGTSGSSIADQAAVLDKAVDGTLSPGLSLAAVGGIEAAQEGLRALVEGRYAGKVMIFPQLRDLDLQSLDDLARSDADLAAALGPDRVWTDTAERLLFEKYHAG